MPGHQDTNMASTQFKTLRDFLTTRMRMAHIYQPLMIRTLLTHGGRASIRQIASMFLSKDASQLEYYDEITKNMPGKVLARHGIVRREGDVGRPMDSSKGSCCESPLAPFAPLDDRKLLRRET